MIKFKCTMKAALFFCILVIFLLQGITSRGLTSGRGNGRNGSSRNNSDIKSSSQINSENYIPNNIQSKESGAYLIPSNLRGGGVLPIYRNPKAQEVTSYYKREGTGMSAWGIVALILGIVGCLFLLHFCYMVGLPIWRDRQSNRGSMSRRPPENIPLQQATPSTATPSPCIAVCLPS